MGVKVRVYPRFLRRADDPRGVRRDDACAEQAAHCDNLAGLARVAELVDAHGSGPCVGNDVGVQVPPRAQGCIFTTSRNCSHNSGEQNTNKKGPLESSGPFFLTDAYSSISVRAFFWAFVVRVFSEGARPFLARTSAILGS